MLISSQFHLNFISPDTDIFRLDFDLIGFNYHLCLFLLLLLFFSFSSSSSPSSHLWHSSLSLFISLHSRLLSFPFSPLTYSFPPSSLLGLRLLLTAAATAISSNNSPSTTTIITQKQTETGIIQIETPQNT